MDRNNELLTNLYAHYIIMKTFHFQTTLGFRHLKVDEYTQKYLDNMDKLMEMTQGIDSKVTTQEIHLNVKMRNDLDILAELERMIQVLQNERGRASSIDSIIDQMQGDLQQLAYLLAFR